jgi:hypothetical protein
MNSYISLSTAFFRFLTSLQQFPNHKRFIAAVIASPFFQFTSYTEAKSRFPKEVWHDKTAVLQMVNVAERGSAYLDASSSLQQDRDVFYQAIATWSESEIDRLFIPRCFENDREIITAYIKRKPSLVETIHSELRTDVNFLLKLVAASPKVIQYLGVNGPWQNVYEWENSRHFVMLAMTAQLHIYSYNECVFQFLLSHVQQDEKILLSAIRANPHVLTEYYRYYPQGRMEFIWNDLFFSPQSISHLPPNVRNQLHFL